MGKLGCLIDSMAKATLLFLIDIVQPFPYVKNPVLVLLAFGIEFPQVFAGKRTLKEVCVLTTFVL